jgi:hypothetical protein
MLCKKAAIPKTIGNAFWYVAPRGEPRSGGVMSRLRISTDGGVTLPRRVPESLLADSLQLIHSFVMFLHDFLYFWVIPVDYFDLELGSRLQDVFSFESCHTSIPEA